MPPSAAARKLQEVEAERNLLKSELELYHHQKKSNRAAYADAPNIGVDLVMLAVGTPPAPMTLPATLLPETTSLILGSQPSNGMFFFLPGESWQTVEVYRLYLYYNKIYTKRIDDVDAVDDGAEVHEDREWHRLMDCYILACTLSDEKRGIS